MGDHSGSYLSLGKPGLRRGNLLQCAVLLLRCAEEVEQRSLPELLYMGQPYRALLPREHLPTRLTGSPTTTITTHTGATQNGHKRNSRVVNDFAPSAIATWDWNINDKMKLTTSVFGKYSMYKSTKLNYNNAENPQPDYWKNLPSSYYDIWNDYALRQQLVIHWQSWNNSVQLLDSKQGQPPDRLGPPLLCQQSGCQPGP